MDELIDLPVRRVHRTPQHRALLVRPRRAQLRGQGEHLVHKRDERVVVGAIRWLIESEPRN
jgi:hypothetical protein